MLKIKNILSAFLLFLFYSCSINSVSDKNSIEKNHSSAVYYYVNPVVFKELNFKSPPAFKSKEEADDLNAVMDWQNKRTADDCSRAQEFADSGYDFVWGDKPIFKHPLPKEVKDFLKRIEKDAVSSVKEMKNRYSRPRPFAAHPDIVSPCITKSKSYSYPSGHASYFRIFANVFGDIVPLRKEEFIERTEKSSYDRVVGGVHYPSDIRAGIVFGDEFHSLLIKNPAYLKEINSIKKYIANKEK
ncbi:MAG: phosphatase PAP2 family protein [Elusimicrobiota bacterium]